MGNSQGLAPYVPVRSLISIFRQYMDPGARLTNGQKAACEGRFEDALREYVWFHDHAIAHNRSYYGVRLSFALGYWMELATSYPAAKTKLEEIRDQKAFVLGSGNGDFELFHDVVSINKCLGAEQKTYDLFLKVIRQSPELALSCADIALEAIIKARDFVLAEKYSADPEDSLIRFSEQLNRDVSNRHFGSKHRARRIEAFIQIYCRRLQLTITILEGLGKVEEADQTREWAVALAQSKPISVRVGEILTTQTYTKAERRN
jgi:hypothetical protein